MNVTIQRWGNSQGIRIPKIVLEQANLSENDQVELTALDDSIILKKITKTRPSGIFLWKNTEYD